MSTEPLEEPYLLPPVPLERLPLASRLDGRTGTNRAPCTAPKQITADNDLAAIRAWLAEFQDAPQTLRTYRKEVERLLLWSLLEAGKPLSSLTREDLARYEAFLADPQPEARWCGRRNTPRHSPAWRPFEGPLSAPSRRQALIILQGFFSYLVHAGYLAGNPLALRRRTRANAPQKPATVERFLEQDLWDYLLEFLEQRPRETRRQTAHYERTRFLLTLLYLLGPRVSEVTSHTMGSFIERRGKWWWHVLGKGGKAAHIPVSEEMLQALVRYRTHLGLTPLPVPGEGTPLILSINGTQSITANMVYRIIKALVGSAAEALESRAPHRAAKLRQASTHWFRHTALTHQADAGIELRYLNKNARHARLETTAIYLHADETAWHEAMGKHTLRPKKA